MIEFAVKLLKNKFYPLQIAESAHVEHGQMVLVRTEKGEEVAQVFLVNEEIAKKWENFKPEFLQLIRPMSQKDLEVFEEVKLLEEDGYKKCLNLIQQHKLGMNLVQCRFTFDKRKVTFYYTASERVDFRDLLKDLTQTFPRVRIDLRHIGVRDETSIVEGCGLCGRPFCCCTFLRKFDSINIKLAKDQGMPITPGKISGTCGRLLCCLNYEYKDYVEASKEMPNVGSAVKTPEGLGRICSINLLNSKLSVKLEDGKFKDFMLNEVEIVDAKVDVDIEIPYKQFSELDETNIDIKQLEDDKNSSTGNV